MLRIITLNLNGIRSDQYTWWSNRGQAWAKNVGWRIDYQIATPALAAAAKRCSICKDQRFSDHAPLTIDYDYSLEAAPAAEKRAANLVAQAPPPFDSGSASAQGMPAAKTPKRTATR